MPTAGAGDLPEFASSPEGAEQAAGSSAPSRVSAAAWGQTPPGERSRLQPGLPGCWRWF